MQDIVKQTSDMLAENNRLALKVMDYEHRMRKLRGMNDHIGEILRLETTIDELRDEIRDLKKAFAGSEWVMPTKYLGLTGGEADLLRLFYSNRGKVVTKSGMYVALYSDREPDRSPDPKIIDVFVCKLRAKLQRWDIKIETVWGTGYYITPEMAARLDSVLTEAQTPQPLPPLPTEEVIRSEGKVTLAVEYEEVEIRRENDPKFPMAEVYEAMATRPRRSPVLNAVRQRREERRIKLKRFANRG